MRQTLHRRPNRGFTLVELLVVLFIVGLLSAATLPILITTLNQRQVQDASRVVQQALINARFAAMSTGKPAGIRLLPDPVFMGPDQSDPLRPLAYNRIMQLEAADDYSDGQLRVHSPGASADEMLDFFLICNTNGLNWKAMLLTNNPVSKGNQDPFQNLIYPGKYRDPRIVLRQFKSDYASIPVPVEPTNWYWNIRAGDRIVVGVQNVSRYVIAGPIAPLSPNAQYDPFTYNPERFVNMGTPPEMLPFQLPTYATTPSKGTPQYPFYHSEIMFVVNESNKMFDGVDNNRDGVADPAFDGLDNDGNGYIDDPTELFYNSNPLYDPQKLVEQLRITGASRTTLIQALMSTFEWDPVTLAADKLGSVGGDAQEYTIKRRMVPSANSAEVGLPADVVIDATTAVEWFSNPKLPNGGQLRLTPPSSNSPLDPQYFNAERSRLPIDPVTRYVDIIFQPDGQVVTSSPASVNGPPFQVPFYHLWLADRADVFPPTKLPANFSSANKDTFLPRLPKPSGFLVSQSHQLWIPDPDPSDGYIPFNYAEWQLKNERRLITIQTHTGRISSQSIESFDTASDANTPFQDAQKGIAEVGQ